MVEVVKGDILSVQNSLSASSARGEVIKYKKMMTESPSTHKTCKGEVIK